MQPLPMELRNQSLGFIFTDRHTGFLKFFFIHKESWKNKDKTNLFFKIFQFQLYGFCWL